MAVKRGKWLNPKVPNQGKNEVGFLTLGNDGEKVEILTAMADVPLVTSETKSGKSNEKGLKGIMPKTSTEKQKPLADPDKRAEASSLVNLKKQGKDGGLTKIVITLTVGVLDSTKHFVILFKENVSPKMTG